MDDWCGDGRRPRSPAAEVDERAEVVVVQHTHRFATAHELGEHVVGQHQLQAVQAFHVEVVDAMPGLGRKHGQRTRFQVERLSFEVSHAASRQDEEELVSVLVHVERRDVSRFEHFHAKSGVDLLVAHRIEHERQTIGLVGQLVRVDVLELAQAHQLSVGTIQLPTFRSIFRRLFFLFHRRRRSVPPLGTFQHLHHLVLSQRSELVATRPFLVHQRLGDAQGFRRSTFVREVRIHQAIRKVRHEACEFPFDVDLSFFDVRRTLARFQATKHVGRNDESVSCAQMELHFVFFPRFEFRTSFQHVVQGPRAAHPSLRVASRASTADLQSECERQLVLFRHEQRGHGTRLSPSVADHLDVSHLLHHRVSFRSTCGRSADRAHGMRRARALLEPSFETSHRFE
mmetsp:Transcript_5754/g.20113  ORF Transcript_5754/g.20113 Transcript_5754/m.20113 type:complete len:399 (+) Transcript_5754:1732-2928(+)